MDPWKKKFRFWKLYFLRILPQCVLSALLFYALSVIMGILFSTKSDTLSNCADLAPGEVLPFKNPEPEPRELYYNNVFKRLFDEGFISRRSKALSIDSTNGQDVIALEKLGVADVTGIVDMPSAEFIVAGQGSYPFENNTFDLEFFGYNTRFKYWIAHAVHNAAEIGRTLKVGGQKIVSELEPLVTFDRPGDWEGPWGNDKATLRYLSSMVDISFKEKYVYIDLGANSYNSSVGMWFDKEYPKQNKDFEIYAVEPDAAFHEEYKGRPGVTLIPYAAWLRNETLTFEIYKIPHYDGAIWDKMGYVQEEKDTHQKDVITTFSVEAFDFADWLLRTVTKRDYVVMKMDVEGDEFKLINRLIESDALCLIDELFLECHYDHAAFNVGPKHNRTLSDCIDLYRNLRKDGCFVHQWW